jgi:hypothetical protein
MPPPNRHILSRRAATSKSSSHHKNAKDYEDTASETPGSPLNKKDESKEEQNEEEEEQNEEGNQNESDQQDEKNDGEKKGPTMATGPADAIKTTVKIFPSSTKNDEGYYISDIRVLTDQKKKPFSISDSLDFELENMIDHISNLSKASQFSIQKEVASVDPSKLDINNYMKHDTTEFLILPTKYSTPAEDAKAKKEKASGGGKKYSRKTKRRISRTRKEHRKKNI